MRIYRRTWCAWWGVLGAAGALTGLVLAAVVPVLVSAALAGLLGSIAAAVLLQYDAGTRVAPSRHVPLIARTGAGVALTTGLVAIWAAVLGPLLWAVLALAALTSPPLVRALLTRGRTRRSGARPARGVCPCGCAAPVTVAEARRLVTLLDDTQLCRAWRGSLARLRGAGTTEEWHQLVVLRGAYLDELEDRDADGVRAWLASVPQPGSVPDLSGQRSDRGPRREPRHEPPAAA